jgi:hypothetical protein
VIKPVGASVLSSVVAALINVAWYGAMLLLALSMCILAVAPWVDPPRVEVGFAVPAAFQLEAGTHRVTASPLDIESVHLDQASGSLRFSPRNRLVVAATAVVIIVVMALMLWVLGLLRAVFRTVRAGQPFVVANATRIRRIAYAVIAAEIARSLFAYVGMRYVMANFAVQGVRFEATPDVNAVVLVCGLIILVIAEVFREGTRLDEEQSLTI